MTAPNVPEKHPFLYVVVCACGIAGDVGKLITAAQERHWDVGVIVAPQGLGFLDTEAIEAQTGYSIRSAWRTPGEARPLPPADAIAVAPATFNTVNKWAAGICDTLALASLRGVRQEHPNRRRALPERCPGRPPRLPTEHGPAARHGRIDRQLRASQTQGRWRR